MNPQIRRYVKLESWLRSRYSVKFGQSLFASVGARKYKHFEQLAFEKYAK